MSGLRRYLLPWLGLIGLIALVRLWPGSGAGDGAALVDGLGRTFAVAPPGLVATVSALGFLLLGAWLTGHLFHQFQLPHLSGYLLFGVLVGPHLPAVLPIEIPALVTQNQLDHLTLVNALAISFIALTAGGEIRLEFLRKGFARISAITITEMAFVFVGVVAMLILGRPLFGFFSGIETEAAIIVCVLIATLAITNSPAVVIAMLGETRAEGPMAQTALTVTILKDLALIILFTIVVAITSNMLGIGGREGEVAGGMAAIGAEEERAALLSHLAWHLVGSIAIGAVIGAALSFVGRRIGDQTAVFVLCSALGIALLSEATDLEPLLVSLGAGFVMANLWPRQSQTFFHEMEQLALPVYAVFFAVAGAKVNLEAVMRYWPLALFVVGVRTVMVVSGTYLGARLTGMENPARRWLWTALIPQAGVTVALIASLGQTFANHEWITALASLLLAIVAIHELFGPMLMRLGLIRSGEVREQS